MEARLAIEAIVTRYAGVTRPRGEITWNRALTVRGPVALPLSFSAA